MLPTAGLFLPETLHRRDGTVSDNVESDAAKLRYFPWKIGRPRQDYRGSDSRPPSSLFRDTPEDSANGFSSLSTTFNFADFVFTFGKASAETLSFANLIQAVRNDVAETSRLYLSPAVSNFLDAWPDKRHWVDNTLHDVRRALNEIGMDMDAAQVDGADGGSITARRKYEWAMSHQRRLSKKQQQLQVCHHHLLGAIHVMQTVELCGLPGAMLQDPIFEAPVRPWVPTDERNALRGPYSRQKCRLSQTNLSISSVNLSEKDKDLGDTRSSVSIPVELQGSSPDDITLPDKMNLYTPPRSSASFDMPSPRQTTLRRSRALSSHVRPRRISDAVTDTPPGTATGPSASVERPIERNDSTMSTTTTINIPIIAKRYRAHAVHVPRQRDRHRSLPSELPYHQSQSSLMVDLVDYVLPGVASEKLPSNEWTSSPVLASPTISITTSCPETTFVSYPDTITPLVECDESFQPLQPLQPVIHHTEFAMMVASDEVFPSTESKSESSPVIAETQKNSPADVEHLSRARHNTMLRASTSCVVRKPLPQSSRSDRSMSLPTIASPPTITTLNGKLSESRIPNHNTELSLLQQRMLRQSYVDEVIPPIISSPRSTTPRKPENLFLPLIGNQAPSTSTDTISDVPSQFATTAFPASTAMPESPIPHPPLPELPAHDVDSATVVTHLPSELVNCTSPKSSAAAPSPVLQPRLSRDSTPLSSTTSTMTAKSSESILSTSSSKPITAQAKRRAAHARRMQIAFGNS